MSDVMTECLFCRVATGEIPAEVVFSNDHFVAFRDISPQAPVHVLVIPREHHRDIGALTADAPQLAGPLMATAAQVAADEGLESGFRVVFNTGSDGGQTVGHVHAHVLGGRPLTWPPG